MKKFEHRNLNNMKHIHSLLFKIWYYFVNLQRCFRAFVIYVIALLTHSGSASPTHTAFSYTQQKPPLQLQPLWHTNTRVLIEPFPAALPICNFHNFIF